MDTNKATGVNKKDKAFTVVGIVLCVILIPLLIINVTMIVKSYVNEDEVPNFLGVTPMIVLSDSMADTILSGDLVIAVDVEPEDVKVGDIISFFDPMSNKGSVVTHRVLEVITEEDGTLAFRTRGDNNNTEDKVPVSAEKLIGRYVFRIPGAGNVAMFMKTTPGLILCVVVPIILFVGYDVLRRRLYEKNKKDNMDELMAELEALRAAKAQTDATETPTEAPTESPTEAPADLTPAETTQEEDKAE